MHLIKPDLCTLCDACRVVCPRNAISVHQTENTYIINEDECNDCNNMSAVRCVPQCPTDAIFKANT
jgi:ferredoxin